MDCGNKNRKYVNNFRKPVPVREQHESTVLIGCSVGLCPNCGYTLTRKSTDKYVRYCPECGTCISWNNPDEKKETDTMNSVKNTKIAPPWVTYRNMMVALFERDPDVAISDVYKDNDSYAVDLEITKHRKYEALVKLLPAKVEFGNVCLKLYIYDEENSVEPDQAALYRDAFENNPIFDYVEDLTDVTGTHHYFVMFEPQVIQFYNDNLQDPNGNWSGLAQDLAKEIFRNVQLGTTFATSPVKVGGTEK